MKIGLLLISPSGHTGPRFFCRSTSGKSLTTCLKVPLEANEIIASLHKTFSRIIDAEKFEQRERDVNLFYFKPDDVVVVVKFSESVSECSKIVPVTSNLAAGAEKCLRFETVFHTLQNFRLRACTSYYTYLSMSSTLPR